jgi:hypothetical protein
MNDSSCVKLCKTISSKTLNSNSLHKLLVSTPPNKLEGWIARLVKPAMVREIVDLYQGALVRTKVKDMWPVTTTQATSST